MSLKLNILRHRRGGNFLANMLDEIAAYWHKPKRPSLKFAGHETSTLICYLKNLNLD
ncbi:hypothetical protein NEOC65_000426 [Neochlamydia sp. AcF65]|nr:hypothetical protein [Neochlamydia sp. AcF65]